MDRRQALALISGTCCCALTQHTGALGNSYDRFDMPCALALEVVDGVGGLPASYRSWDAAKQPIVARSDFPDMEAALGIALVHMSRFYEVRPDFGFIFEKRAPNAHATSYSATNNGFGTIAFGRALMSREIAKPNGDFAVLAICAHEFGHIRQYYDDYNPGIRASLPSYCVELHADFLAGAFLAYWKRMMSVDDLLRVGDTWSQLGSSDFNNPGSHGTTEQRVLAIESGFFFRDGVRDASIDQIMQAGLQHVSRYR